jgi:hypothetical protein
MKISKIPSKMLRHGEWGPSLKISGNRDRFLVVLLLFQNWEISTSKMLRNGDRTRRLISGNRDRCLVVHSTAQRYRDKIPLDRDN